MSIFSPLGIITVTEHLSALTVYELADIGSAFTPAVIEKKSLIDFQVVGDAPVWYSYDGTNPEPLVFGYYVPQYTRIVHTGSIYVANFKVISPEETIITITLAVA